MIKRKDIAERFSVYLGLPFAHQGRSKEGVDCIGSIVLLTNEHNINTKGYIDDPRYGRDPDSRLHLQIDKHLNKIHPRPEIPPVGTIILFRWGRYGQHLGIMVDSNFFVHAYEAEGAVVKTRLDKRWQARILGVYDFEGVTE